MPELEVSKKTCFKCGTNCDSLVLICPNCSEVLPDGKLPTNDYTLFKFLPSIGFVSTDIAIRKIVLFLIALAIVIGVVSSWQRHLPG